MSRWNVANLAFYGTGGRRREIKFDLAAVNVITGASGTGKTAIIEAIDYCLGSTECGLPFFVRKHAEAVAVHWTNGDSDLIVGRRIPKAGRGTDQMFVKTGRNLSLAANTSTLEGPTNRETARAIIEKTFGIADVDDAAVAEKSSKGRATIRDVTPYLFLSGDVIISKVTLLHDLNRPEKARDIKATMPYFLGAVDQTSVLAGRRLKQLEAALARIERSAKAQQRSQGLLTERCMYLLTQAHGVGLVDEVPTSEESDESLLGRLKSLSANASTRREPSHDDQRGKLEGERRDLVTELQELRSTRQALRRTMNEASGYETAVSGQSHKLALVEHLKLDDGRCPVCEADNVPGRTMASQIRRSLAIVAEEVASVDVMRPRLQDHAGHVEGEIGRRTSRLRDIETQLSGLVRLEDEAAFVGSSLLERVRVVGRIDEFLDTTAKDFAPDLSEADSLLAEIDSLREKVDPQGRRDRLRDSENLIGTYATDMLGELPTVAPATDARILFTATPKLSIIEPTTRAALAMAEIGSDQNYLAMHLALSFSLQKLFQTLKAPVPGLIVIDQVSRPYYPEGEGGDEKGLAEMKSDDDRLAMQKIVKFLFEETARQAGLQVILIEHAYIDSDPQYVAAVKGRWTRSSGEKLIPSDWPERG